MGTSFRPVSRGGFGGVGPRESRVVTTSHGACPLSIEAPRVETGIGPVAINRAPALWRPSDSSLVRSIPGAELIAAAGFAGCDDPIVVVTIAAVLLSLGLALLVTRPRRAEVRQYEETQPPETGLQTVALCQVGASRNPARQLQLFVNGSPTAMLFGMGSRINIGSSRRHANDIVFDDDALVGATHARIVVEPEGDAICYLADMATNYGTTVLRGGERYQVEPGVRFPLFIADIVIIGGQKIVIGNWAEFRGRDDEDGIGPTHALPLRYMANGDQFPFCFRPENRRTDKMWQLRRSDPQTFDRLTEELGSQVAGRKRRWPINFVVVPHEEISGKYVIIVAPKYWERQSVPEEGVKHVQLAGAGHAIWAGELDGVFDERGNVERLLFNANSGEYGKRLMGNTHEERVEIVRALLARKTGLDSEQIEFVASI